MWHEELKVTFLDSGKKWQKSWLESFLNKRKTTVRDSWGVLSVSEKQLCCLATTPGWSIGECLKFQGGSAYCGNNYPRIFEYVLWTVRMGESNDMTHVTGWISDGTRHTHQEKPTDIHLQSRARRCSSQSLTHCSLLPLQLNFWGHTEFTWKINVLCESTATFLHYVSSSCPTVSVCIGGWW